MSDQFRFAFKNSPFLPVFDQNAVVEMAVDSISCGIGEPASIALATFALMDFHAALLRVEKEILIKYSVKDGDLDSLNLGFQYPIETIMCSAVCMQYPKEQRQSVLKEIFNPSRRLDVFMAQGQIGRDINATVNLLAKDPSGSLVFRFLTDYPFSQDEFFLNGMEIAAIVFSGISQAVADKTGKNDWLNKPYDPTVLD